MLADLIASYSMKIGIVGTIVLLFFVALAIILEIGKVKYNKIVLFLVIILVTVLPSLYFIGSTIYLNTVSSSGGPVHWHADIEVWACGKELDFLNPEGISNKVGTAVLHEHNDKRIHLEGVVVNPSDASLGNFFKVIGGQINNSLLSVPTNDGVQTFINGSTCPDGTNATLQVFVYSTKDGIYTQTKIDNPESYIITPDSQVPAGDCIIVEFGPEIEFTDKLCRSYKVAENIGKIAPAVGTDDGLMRGDNYGN